MVSSSTSTGTGAPHRRQPVQCESHYYTTNNLFEQSLDIYRPAAGASEKKASSPPPPIVALVVGSAWLGHRSIIYKPTSWWNSSGPKGVANLGCVCVCIRHRGSFPKTFSILTMVFVAVAMAMLSAFVNAVAEESVWNSLEAMLGGRMFTGRAGGFLLAFATGLILVELGGVGAANFDDMQNDVMDALAWLHDNEERLRLARVPSVDSKSRRRLFIFGGYSSGGHVAATVLQQPSLWKDRNLPPPHVHCDSALFVSPVLSAKSRREIPSKASEPPTWFTDQVVESVFGDDAPAVPSPMPERSPRIPHLLLGCREETFGLDWLDAFFCSASFCELLNGAGVVGRYRAVQSDHWNILNSSDLSRALGEGLEWIARECCKDGRSPRRK